MFIIVPMTSFHGGKCPAIKRQYRVEEAMKFGSICRGHVVLHLDRVIGPANWISILQDRKLCFIHSKKLVRICTSYSAKNRTQEKFTSAKTSYGQVLRYGSERIEVATE